jgi:uncharacterized delta-60 repeat protein
MPIQRQKSRRLPLVVLAAVLLGLMLAAANALAFDLDPTFGDGGTVITPAANGSLRLRAMAEDRSGNIIGAGLAGESFDVSRFSAAGQFGTSFGQATAFAGHAEGEGIALQRDGKIVVAGFSSLTPSDLGSIAVVRYNRDGIRDTNFGRDGRVTAPGRQQGLGLGVAIQQTGRILIAGTIHDHTLRPQAVVVGYTPKGTVDKTFGHRGWVRFKARGTPFTALTSLKVLPGGSVLGAGYFRNQLLLTKLKSNGKLDRGFGGGDGKVVTHVSGNGGCTTLCGLDAAVDLQSNGKIVVQGYSDSGAKVVLARYRADGRLDRKFGHRGLVNTKIGVGIAADGMAIQNNDKIVVAGDSEKGGRPRFTVLRYTAQGRLDPKLGNHGVLVEPIGTDSAANAVLIQRDGSVVVGGNTKTGRDESLVLLRFAGD